MSRHTEPILLNSESNTTPLYDMFAKHIEPLIASFPINQYRYSKLGNMFSFQLVLIGFLVILSCFSRFSPPLNYSFSLIRILLLLAVLCGFYSMATRDPLGMLIYTLLNFIALVYCSFNNLYAIISMSCILLLLNQIRSIGYLIEFGKEKLAKREDIIESLSSIYQSNK